MTRSSTQDRAGRVYGGESAAARAARQRRAFMDAGRELLGTVGYRAMTVRTLSKEAGLTDRYFYKNFGDTEELLLAVYGECIDDIEASVLEAIAAHPDLDDTDAAIVAGLDAFFTAFEDGKLARVCWLEVLGVSPRVDAAYSGRILRFATVIETFARQRSPSIVVPDEELQQLAIGLVGAIVQSAMQWLLSDYAAARQSLVAANARLLRATFASLDV